MRSDAPKKDKSIGIRLPLETFEALKIRADAERRSVSNYLLLLIERDLNAYQKAVASPGKLDVIDAIGPKPGPETRAHLDAVMRGAPGMKLEMLRTLLSDAFDDGALSAKLNEPRTLYGPNPQEKP